MATLVHDLLSQAQSGDHEALEQLLERHGPVVRQQVQDRIPQRWQSVLSADDVMQQTYVDAFADTHRFVPDGEDSFSAWLSCLARCNLLDALKMLETDKRGRGHRRVDLQRPEDSFVALYETLGTGQSTPSRHLARDEACTSVRWAVQQLPEAYRLVVQMYDLEDCPVEDVARALQRSPGAVYMMRARAHRRLREILGSRSRYLSAG